MCIAHYITYVCLFLFFQDMAVATVYTNLGDEAVAHALNETQVKVVVLLSAWTASCPTPPMPAVAAMLNLP